MPDDTMLKLVLFLCILPALLKAVPSESFINEVVDRHNYYRAKHGVANVTVDPEISKAAQEWAEHLEKSYKMFLSGGEIFKRDPNVSDTYGASIAYSNIAAFISFSGTDLVDDFYTYEAKEYAKRCEDMSKYKDMGIPVEPSPGATTHYTQIVWKSTLKIGVGQAGFYYVVYYEPPGNILHQYSENVPCIDIDEPVPC